MSWLHEVRHWLRDDNQQNPWGTSDFFITPGFRDDTLLRVDLYASGEGMSAVTLEHVIRQLARPFAGRAEMKQEQALHMSTARLMARSFEALLKSGYHLRLTPIANEADQAGYAIAGATYEFVRGRVKAYIIVDDGPTTCEGTAPVTVHCR